MDSPDRLRARPTSIRLELTSKCNLRCVYCAASQPGFVGRELDVDWEELTAQLVALHPAEVHISGHGESTSLAGWHERARLLLERGLALSLTTNLVREYDEDELDVLASMACVTVSCDTCDPELYASVRRGGQLARLEKNLERLRNYCAERSRQKPYVCINAVLADLFVPGLPDLARWAHRHGVDGLSIVNLLPYPGVADQPAALRHPSEVDPAGALAALDETRKVAEELCLCFNTMPGLERSLEEACAP